MTLNKYFSIRKKKFYDFEQVFFYPQKSVYSQI